ncbi:MAG: ribosome assembly RNA-binding protein YhbY [Tissierellales bacterium]|nr:ribosome assembly RNA-binding protein YhbY [Tissierellales bacterium]
MITGKQRSYLKKIANNTESIFQIGKNGITENFIKQVDEALNAREIVKINILKNSELDNQEIIEILTERLKAEFVQSIGRKITIYRESKDKIIKLPN